MMPRRHQAAARMFIAGALWLCASQAHADTQYQLEKVVELSRHGIRPPTPGNRKDIEAATHRTWTTWTTHDGELTGHGYAAVANKGRWEGEHYRELGLLTSGCPQSRDIYVRASPLQRTRATAQALVDGAFPGCGVEVHRVEGEDDPLFQTEAFPATNTDPAKQLAAVKAVTGDLAARQRALQPAVLALKRAVCSSDADCSYFDKPWQIKQNKSGKTSIDGLSVLANMVETLRLGWSENLPLSQLAWGNITSSAQITAVLPLLTANYDLGNDVMYTAQKRGSILLNAMLQGVEQGVSRTTDKLPDTRWLLLVAHDTNIAMVRTLMNFTWTLSGYTRGNIPPGSSLVFERWRDTKSGERFLHVYFQGQSLDDLRRLQAIDKEHPLLREEWRQSDCRVTGVGTLCPMKTALKALSRNLDPVAITPVRYQ
ncbi:histidine-type phosphatase [Pantoea dispersa]|uniref:histidine-type phosphatase n=1 Tax=Pantoea dispersa TaxID=59814 RepID=UPI0021F6FB4F|nr:histidine-type phosphatase [Pantoea dispersa]MCW0323489.1 Glucose-1-phosphatase [Pantoea dispersa]MCW0328225.1 Glucose-1-phosphatase [Pantoea dispersa]MCW0434576.1 Glucose-1-phosphatase [Pantoea dispersa]